MKRIMICSMAATCAWALLGCNGAGSQQGGVYKSRHNGHGKVFYCDGAGGGGIINWGGNVRSGLKQGGYQGEFEMFPWETGLGVIADQDAAVSFKRDKATKLAAEIVAFKKQYPNESVHLMGLSAGTAVAAFTLEALPENVLVDEVVLLSGSLSSAYDMTKALKRVKGTVHITTSQTDAILTGVVPGTGSADRKMVGDRVIGVHGCTMPARASADTRRLYSKIILMRWNPSWKRDGEYGGHTDSTNPAFVAHHIAPLIVREGPRTVQLHKAG